MDHLDALHGPALADALWACVAPDGSRPLVSTNVRKGRTDCWDTQTGSLWRPWQRLSDCWPCLVHYRMYVGLDELYVGADQSDLVSRIADLTESAVATAICRLALRLWGTEGREG